MFNLAKMAKEAAAIALYESHMRSRKTGRNYPSWFELKPAERQGWRYRISEIVKKEVA